MVPGALSWDDSDAAARDPWVEDRTEAPALGVIAPPTMPNDGSRGCWDATAACYWTVAHRAGGVR
jgi:hypothetical protein